MKPLNIEGTDTKVSYGGTDGSAWLQLPAIPGYRIFSVKFVLMSDTKTVAEMGEWHVLSAVAAAPDGKSWSAAEGAVDYGKMRFSASRLDSKVFLIGSEYGAAAWCLSEKTYNGELSEIHLSYERE